MRRAVVVSFLMALLALAGCADAGTPLMDTLSVQGPAGTGSLGPAGNQSPGNQQNGSAGTAGAQNNNMMNRPPMNAGSGALGMAGRGGTAGAVANNGAAGRATPPPAAGMTGGGAAGMSPPPPPPNGGMPIIPDVMGDCPEFRSGTISFMGLGGIDLQAGAKAAGPTAPMVFYWHGTGSFSGEYAGLASAVYQGVISEGGVLVSFQDTTGGDLNSGTFIFGESDFKLTDQLLACAVKNHNIDPRRVFATGCSAGGLFSTAMAAIRSNYLAAAAPNSGGFTVPARFQNDWTPALMTIHGAPGVDVVGIDFSTSSKTADDAFKARGGFVINCNHGGGHCGGGGLAPDIWNFFKNHPYGTKPSPWASALPAGFNSACKIY